MGGGGVGWTYTSNLTVFVNTKPVQLASAASSRPIKAKVFVSTELWPLPNVDSIARKISPNDNEVCSGWMAYERTCIGPGLTYFLKISVGNNDIAPPVQPVLHDSLRLFKTVAIFCIHMWL